MIVANQPKSTACTAPRRTRTNSVRAGHNTRSARFKATRPRADNDCGLPRISVSSLQVTDEEVIDWGITMLGVDELWKQTRGKGIKVAVLDTGVVVTHPDLKDRIIDAKDFTGSPFGPVDKNGHGTHCAGIVAATDNTIGVVGVAPEASLLCGKVLGDSGGGDLNNVVDGIDWAVQAGADIISLSLGGAAYPPLEKAVNSAISKGVIVVAAAGNDGGGSFLRRDTLNYPGAYKDVICVGSIDRSGDRSGFSSVGYNIDIMAPGGQIRSCWIPPVFYATISGTSMATPFVAGICALALAKNRADGGAKIDQRAMFELLKTNADDIGKPGFDKRNGWGLVDVGFLEA